MTAASRSGASVVRWLAGLATVAVLIVGLSWQREQVAPSGDDAGRGDHVRPRSGEAGVRPAAPVLLEERTPPEEALGAIDPRQAWRAQAARAIRPIVTERLGHAPSPAEEARLLDALARIGPAARSLDREMLRADDPSSIARVREQTRVLIEADRTCRALLGIGAAELLRRLDPSRIEDEGAEADG